jgi:DNA invertase Pin-like site-specific DNA recombinase
MNNLTTIKQVVIYARVSRSDESQDPENQLQPLRERCKREGWLITKEYVDRCSGAKDSRPAFNLMMDEIERDVVNSQAVICVRVDRLGRSTQHLHNTIAKLKEAGRTFIADGLDLSNPCGELMFAMLAAVAQFERSLIIERTRAGVARVRASGKHIGRPLLTGKVSAATLRRRELRAKQVV